MYCLDTNVIVDYLRGNEKVVEKVKNLAQKGEIATTTINLCELYKGIHSSKNAQKELFVLDNFTQAIEVLDLNPAVCRRFGERFNHLREKGKVVGDFDLMIAVIADANNAILVTSNKKHFEDSGVKIEAW